jgi:LysM repeat protein
VRIGSRICIVACCAAAALALAACGGGAKSNSGDGASAPTATLPATLSTPVILANGVAQTSGGATYTIKSGDTLAGIAARFSISLDDLRAANPGIDAGRLTVGTTVRLPGGTNTTPAPQPTAAGPTDTPEPAPTDTPGPTNTPATIGQTYTVQPGDIPVTIAEKFGITVEALLAANPGLDPHNMHAGDVIIIPPKPAE